MKKKYPQREPRKQHEQSLEYQERIGIYLKKINRSSGTEKDNS